jgi:hypothetical protein
MPHAVLEIVGSNQKFEALPLQVTQRVATASAVARLALLVPAILLVMIPVGSLSFSTTALAQFAEHPADAALASLGVGLFVALFGLPLSRAVRALVSRRSVRIEAGFITVEDRGLLGTRSWTLPLSAYQGVAHIVRTSLSGARHELVLVHPHRGRRVLLCASDRLSDADLDQASRLLSLPLVPANDLYRWPAPRTKAKPDHPEHARAA